MATSPKLRKTKPKLRKLSDQEREMLLDCYFDIHVESDFHNQALADKLYEDLLKRGEIWIQVA